MQQQEILAAAKEDFQSLSGIKGFVAKMLIFQHYAIKVLHLYKPETIEDFVSECIGKPPQEEKFYLWYYQWYVKPTHEDDGLSTTPQG
jgi:hypothetical protein